MKRTNKGSRKGLPLVPLPPMVGRRIRLTFCSKFGAIETAAGAGVYNFYRLNGPYDPDTSILSAATPGLSTYAALYSRMRVYSASIAVDGIASAAAEFTAMVSIVPTAFQTVLPSNPDYWPVQRLAVSKPVPPKLVVGGPAYTGNYSLKANYNISDVMNVTRAQYLDEADFSSLTTSNPTRQAYFAVCLSTRSSVPMGIAFYVRISYDVEFFDPFPLQ